MAAHSGHRLNSCLWHRGGRCSWCETCGEHAAQRPPKKYPPRRFAVRDQRARRKAARRAYLASKPRPCHPLYAPNRCNDGTPEPRNGWCVCDRHDLRTTGGVCRYINPDPDRAGRFACFGIPF